MNTISNTAYYCCGVRMQDAAMTDSLCNDHYAQRFMDEHGSKIFKPLQDETLSNLCCAIRCRVIDDMVQSTLNKAPETTVITVGAGFDSRPYRLKGGHWYEIDEAHLFDVKNERLPISESNNALTRISIDFQNEQLSDKLNSINKDNPILVVIEGVMIYLPEDIIANTLEQLRCVFPQHVLICDLMTRKFAELSKGSIYEKLSDTGAEFAPPIENPKSLFEHFGYSEIEYVPHYEKASQSGALWRRARIARPVAWLSSRVLCRTLNSYGVYRFAFSTS